MSSVQVRILSGPAAGTRLRIDRPIVTFGRAPECDLTIDQAFVSREHGKIVLGPKGWVLENQSANGTVVGGKRVTKKPRPITAGQIVGIGNEDIFEVTSLSEAPTTVAEGAAEDAAAEKRRLSGKTKLWIGIGVYMFLMLGLFIIFSSMSKNSGPNDPISRLQAMTERDIRDQVSEQIRSTLPKQPPDTRLAREHTTNALRFYNQRFTDPQAWINALHEYRKALAYTPGPRLEDIEDDKRYLEVQEHLIDQVTSRYYRAYNLLRNRSLDRADEEFRELSRIYHAPGTPLYDQIQTYWDITKAQLRRR